MSRSNPPRKFQKSVAEQMRDYDSWFFAANPGVPAFARAFVPGEEPGVSLPPGSMVVVQRDGGMRKRTFLAADTQGN